MTKNRLNVQRLVVGLSQVDVNFNETRAVYEHVEIHLTDGD